MHALVLAMAFTVGLGASTDGGGSRFSPRLLEKDGHAFFLAGGAYLARGDYYTNPAVTAGASYYLSEDGGPELRLGWAFSALSPGGKEVFARTGLLPDARQPNAFVFAGWRQTLGYGKTLLAAVPDAVLHFDLQLFADAGAVRTDGGVSPALLVGPGLLARLNRWVFFQADLGLSFSREVRRDGWLTTGIVPALSVGTSL